jgi:hypothetical protein
MKNIRKEVAIWIQLGSFICVWLLLLLPSGSPIQIGWETLRRFPEAVMIYSAGHLLFTARAWRWKAFQGWLVPFPDLQGTWAGTIQTTWKDSATELTPAPIPVLLVIRQSFSSVHCVMYSKESMSSSTAAQIVDAEGSGQSQLCFIYSNWPLALVRDRSQMHEGAVILKMVRKPKRVLEGQYWTDRKTTGDIQVLFRSKNLMDRFSM